MTLPLAQLRVMVTRPGPQAPELVALLQAQGAEVRVCPAIAVQPLSLSAAQAAHLQACLPDTDWLVFTSVNGVLAWQSLPSALRQTLPQGCRVAVTGPATAAAVMDAGLNLALYPDEHTGQALAQALLAYHPRRVLALRAQAARPELPAVLAAHGIPFDDLPLYATQPLPAPESLPPADVITFTSPSAVTAFAVWGAVAQSVLQSARIAVIGPTTAAAARQQWGRVDLQADPYTLPGLVNALVQAYAGVAR